jgi:hypothetical protein
MKKMEKKMMELMGMLEEGDKGERRIREKELNNYSKR